MWGRLSLRMQVAIAVLVPCLAVVLFCTAYFPARQREVTMELLQKRVRAVGLLVAQHPAMLAADGTAASQERLLQVLSALEAEDPADGSQGFTLHYQGLLWPDGGPVFSKGTIPEGVKEQGPVPAGTCETSLRSLHKEVVVRCASGERTYVAGFSVDEAVSSVADLKGYVWMGLVWALLLGLLLAFIISRGIVEPVSRVTEVVRDVSRGDMSRGELDVSATGELRLMAQSFNDMLGTLRTTVMELVSRTEQLSGASRGLLGASADQEHVISQQAAYAQQIAATFEELSRTAEQISSSTEVVESSARRTHEAVAEAMAVVAQVVAGINDIRTESKGVADAIVGLNQDLQQVSKIAQVINQVAERSDLLALNAALEGTKAGEVGRGFSLVAAEMRKLAENVSASARDIARIVEKVQDSGEEAASKARVGMATSDRGVEVAEQASAVFQRIVELARGTSEAARQITIATRQQRQSSEQAVQGARNVAELVKQGVDATGRTTRIAQDLQAVAEGLTAVTSRFKTTRS
ncbi:methyl-accepting chemotaxis protein [Myxococcus sp. RHSTA-1-4]|uniref:methyl-accepting chemotaxis protein n=1 Tax=Myxococcus sp. RHSTA-1-4 TaxID=2874601 RepID=UPI001CBA6FCE|nr:methyl-accepting chemotaxis protein [Myxococcus sp. RHSTA-1-4]MBZ4415625.1 methyl-accepting chemotaxis protein [Myxococcus sp. RHSTA-1-4]